MARSGALLLRLPLLTASAAASGAAALALELLWGRELALTFGASQYAVTAVLAAFMLGLGAGSAFGGRLADRVRTPARTVALLELALAVLGPALSAGLLHLPALAGALLPHGSASGAPFLLGRLGLGLAVMLPATALMGATFPLLARAAADSVPSLHRGLALLYAANTAGGMAGALAAGLILLPVWGIPGTVAAAAGANLVAAGLALAAGRSVGSRPTPAPREPLRPALLAAAGLSGALVLGAEALWHRALLVVLSSTTATLTVLLAVTLGGLALGGRLAPAVHRRWPPLAGWGGLQLGTAAVLLAQAALLPRLAELVRWVRPEDGWGRVLVPPVVAGGLLVLPAALLLGAAWPLLLAAAAPRLEDGGRRVGTMGVLNAVGAAVGAAVVGFAALPAIGFGRSLLLLAAAHAALAAAALRRARPRPAAAAAAGAVLILVAAAAVPRFGRVLLPSMAGPRGGTQRLLAYHESPAGTVVVSEDPASGVRSMHVDSNAVIGTTAEALKVVRLLGLVPIVLHPAPERVLVVGFGAGVTTATVLGSPAVREVEVVEIVPAVTASAGHFAAFNHDPLLDPRVRLSLNDGRNHLLLAGGAYDAITCDPVHPLLGSAPLYSLDFFRLCRSRLAPGGVMCQYLPLHRMPRDAFRRAVATFQGAFPETWVLFSLGHAVLVGRDRPLDLDWQLWARRLATHRLHDDLAASALAAPAQVAALLQLDPEGCRAIGVGPPSTDLHPRLEFLAPRAYQPGLWAANAKALVEGYRSPLGRIRNLPDGMAPELHRLVAGKRLLLFAMLERDRGNLDGTLGWLRRALEVAGDDPEVVDFARQVATETRALSGTGEG